MPVIHSLDDFIVDEHPTLHPSGKDYTRYWNRQERLCIEGKWGEDRNGDEGGWRYMPGNLYFYINMCIIADEDEETGTTTAIISPELRDVEWYLAYGWLAARGFSGFAEDDNYTCHRLVKKIESGEELSPKENILLDKRRDHLTKDNGEWKEYIEAKEYLYKTHDKPLGRPLYHNSKLNLFVLGARGFGKSYFAANAVVLHEFIFFGKKYFNEQYLENPAGVQIVGGSAKTDKINETMDKAMRSLRHLEENVGAWGKGDDFVPGWFHLKTKGKPKTTSDGLVHEYDKKTSSGWQKKGTGSTISTVTYTTENPEAAVGTRPTVMFIEETGICHNLLDVHAANETCQIRRTKFGSSLYIGTGGNFEKITESKIMFEDPKSFKFLPYTDVFENRANPIGLFIPAYYVDNDFKDENGNTDIEAAFEQEMVEREKRKDSGSSAALDGYIVYRPIVPSEMFVSKGNAIFPTARLRERLIEVENEEIDQLYGTTGEFVFDENGDVQFNPMIEEGRKPIKELNVDAYKGRIEGCWIVYESPPFNNMPRRKYRHSLYKVVYDPVKDDEGGTSLASVLVYKGYADKSWEGGMQDTIVAEWIGRFNTVDQAHEQAVKAALYYNATIMPETNIPDFLRYCRKRNNGRYRHLLQPSPHQAIKKVVNNPGFKYDVGIDMTSPSLHVQAEQLIRQWLLTPIVTREDGTRELVVDRLLSVRLLKELVYYERDRNLDHVSSLKLLAIWLSQEVEEPVVAEDAEEDDFDEIDQIIHDRIKEKTIADNAFYTF